MDNHHHKSAVQWITGGNQKTTHTFFLKATWPSLIVCMASSKRFFVPSNRWSVCAVAKAKNVLPLLTEQYIMENIINNNNQ